jgi:hypothetical protein
MSFYMPRNTNIASITVAQRTPSPAMTTPDRFGDVIGGGTSGMSILLDLKKRVIYKGQAEHLLCQPACHCQIEKDSHPGKFSPLGRLS